MKVKRFVAPNMSQALKKVREEVGEDAVILSNKRVPDGIELVTAVDQPDTDSNDVYPADMQPGNPRPTSHKVPSKLEVEVDRMQNQARQRAAQLAATLGKKEQGQFAKAMAQQTTMPQPEPEVSAQLNTATTAAKELTMAQAVEAAVNKLAQSQLKKVASDEDSEVQQMRMELQSMRHLMEQQLSTLAWGQYASSEPEKASLWRRLKRMGIQPLIADKLLNSEIELSEHKYNWMQLMQHLSRDIPVVDGDLINLGGVFSFVGPTGAGKTTSVGKLAARYVMEHGAENLVLITTDTYRIAAHEQLRTIGRILNVPVKIVDKKNPIDRVLYSLRHKKLVLIDTAGLNHQDERLALQTQTMNELGEKIKTVLVLPTTSQPQVLKAAYHHYKTDNLAACILTKLDETASLGESISLSIEKSLAIAYSTNGQNIPDDIAVAEAATLVRAAIDLAKHHRADDDDMSEELQALIG